MEILHLLQHKLTLLLITLMNRNYWKPQSPLLHPSDSHTLYQEKIQSLKEACRAKDIMMTKLLETIENLSSNKNYNNCNTTTTNNSFNNDSETPISNNTHLVPPRWNILSTTSDTTTTFGIIRDRLTSYQVFQFRSNYVN